MYSKLNSYICQQIIYVMNSRVRKTGILDLMEKQRFKPQHVQKALLEYDTPGNWSSIQNIYNLVNGNTRPKDPYVYVILANLLNVDLELIINRYTSVRKKIAESTEPSTINTQEADAFDW